MAKDSILLVGPSWVGDMVMAQSLFKLLKTSNPDVALDVLAPAWSLPIVARMPEIRNGIDAETGHGEIGIGKRRRIAHRLRESRYSRAIVLPRSFKAALIPWFARIPIRTGYRGESRYFAINDIREFDASVLDQTVKRFLALGLQNGEALPPIQNPRLNVSVKRQRELIEKLSLASDRPVVAMMPGAEYGPAKCWPLQHFRALAKLLEETGFDVWIIGSDKDATAGDEIAKDTNTRNLCGRTALEDVVDLMGLCRHAVSNDSGLMHIAAAVGTHVHAVYGSSSPQFTPPLTSKRDIHCLDLDCSPCFERICPLGHLRCLTDIKPQDIHAKMV